jgi:hypothetical protein
MKMMKTSEIQQGSVDGMHFARSKGSVRCAEEIGAAARGKLDCGPATAEESLCGNDRY